MYTLYKILEPFEFSKTDTQIFDMRLEQLEDWNSFDKIFDNVETIIRFCNDYVHDIWTDVEQRFEAFVLIHDDSREIIKKWEPDTIMLKISTICETYGLNEFHVDEWLQILDESNLLKDKDGNIYSYKLRDYDGLSFVISKFVISDMRNRNVAIVQFF